MMELRDSPSSEHLIAPSAPYIETESYIKIRVELAKQLEPAQSVTKAGIRHDEGMAESAKVSQRKSHETTLEIFQITWNSTYVQTKFASLPYDPAGVEGR